MSQPSVRKQKKQKDREWRVAKKKQEALEQRVYARKFPAYEIQANNADHGFVQFIERSLRDIDFRDGTLFDPKETEFLKHVKREPGEVIPALHRGIADHNLSAMHLASMVPRWDSYLGLGDVFALFYDCRRFEPCELHAGR